VEFAVTLQYPNGRRYDAVLTTDQAPQQGTTFVMHGHRWIVSGLIDMRHRDRLRREVDPAGKSTRVLCVRAD
jgi:uncharacterized protein YifN (PemK superfamily)